MTQRCDWAEVNDSMRTYHDVEWGVPVHDDRKLFEFLVLDAFQAGLSWATILNKRENFRAAFHGFDATKIARYAGRSVDRLLKDAGIIRNRQKIEATIRNARAFLRIQEAVGSFDAYIWQFVDGTPKQNRWSSLKKVPATTRQSDAMSKDLKERGFGFAGSTICYAFMQAAGLVNDHLTSCLRYDAIKRMGADR